MCSSNKEFQERFLRLSMDDGDGVDCEFMLGPQNVVIKGHKCIFSAASEVFKAMFYGDLKEEKVVKVEDLDPEGFKGMKQYIYLGEVNFTSTIHALLTCVSARKYMVPGLGEECIKYVEEKLLPSEVLEFYENCKVLCISEFDHICYNIIQENTDEVVESENFLSSKMETIEQLLKFPYLKLESEGKLFAHFERWALAEADRENISSELIQSRFNNLKKHIRFLTMSLKEFAFYVHQSELLTREENNSIAQILMNVNSEPMPKSLSLEKLHRRFKKQKNFRVIASPLPLCKVNYQYGHIFTILMATPCFSFSNFMMGYLTNYDKISIKVTCIETLGKYLCFYFYCSKDVFYEVGDQEILNIESRLRVLTKEGHGNDLYFVNKSHVIVLDWNVSWGENPKFPFAKIPIVDLKNKYFLKDNSKRVFIEALFNFTIEKR